MIRLNYLIIPYLVMDSITSVISMFGAVVLFAGTPILTDHQALAISAIPFYGPCLNAGLSYTWCLKPFKVGLSLNSQYKATAPTIVPPGKVGQGVATCPTGTVATGGGFFVNGPVKTNIVASFPEATSPLKSWVVEAFNPTAVNAKFQTFVVCTSIMP